MATAQRTSVEALRRELELRFEDEEFYESQGASELLSEMVIDPKALLSHHKSNSVNWLWI